MTMTNNWHTATQKRFKTLPIESLEYIRDDALAAAKAGAHIATIPSNVLTQMMQHPLTDIGITRFLTDWQRVSR